MMDRSWSRFWQMVRSVNVLLQNQRLWINLMRFFICNDFHRYEVSRRPRNRLVFEEYILDRLQEIDH